MLSHQLLIFLSILQSLYPSSPDHHHLLTTITTITSIKFGPVNKKIYFLLKNEIWADKYESFTRGSTHGFKRILNWREKSQSTLEITINSINYTHLKYTARHPALQSYNNSQIISFKSIPSAALTTIKFVTTITISLFISSTFLSH